MLGGVQEFLVQKVAYHPFPLGGEVLGFNWSLEHSWQNSCLVLEKPFLWWTVRYLLMKDSVVGEA